MDRRIITALLTYTGLIVLLGALFLLLEPVIPALSWAAVIAIATFPLYARLRQALRWHDTWVALAMTAFTFLLLLLPAALVAAMLVQDVATASEHLDRLSSTDVTGALQGVLHTPWVAAILERAARLSDALHFDLKGTAAGEGRRLLSFLFGSLSGAFGRAASLALQFPVMVVALFFFYRDGLALTDRLWEALPVNEPRRRALQGRMEDVIAAVVIGILGTAIVQGLLAGIGYWAVGLPSPVLLSALTAIASLVPVVGTAVIWLPAGLYLVITGSTLPGLALMGWCALAVGSTDNVLRPMLTSGRTGLPFSLRMLGLLAGIAAFGIIGLVLGPLILAACALTLDFYRAARRERIAADAAPSSGAGC